MRKIKRLGCFIISLSIILSATTVSAYAKSSTLTISADDISHDVSQTLYGMFIEDISYAGDGGLVSNLISNNSFEYEDNNNASWNFNNVNAVLSTSSPMNENNPTYQTFTIENSGSIENIGYVEYYDYKTYDFNDELAQTADMGFKEGETYEFYCYIKNVDFDGVINVYLNSSKNCANISQITLDGVSTNEWTKVSTTLTAVENEDGSLVIEFIGSGSLCFDFASLVSQSSYGYGTSEWKYTSLRQDLYDAIEALSPSFIRFPGGCFAEGYNLEHIYSWKDTIGELESRKQSINLWGDGLNGKNYVNTNSLGYHEYFQLCEDVGAEAIPVVNAAMSCQARCNFDNTTRANKKLDMTDDEWVAYLINVLGYSEDDTDGINEYTEYIESLGIETHQDYEDYLDTFAYRPGTDEFANYAQDVLDLIEYANGDAETTYWGALRAANGHEEPFNMKYISIGNENCGDVYFRNFEALKEIINEAYPDIIVISSAGAYASGTDFDDAWEIINEEYTDTIVDEHYYTSDNYLFENNDRYDSYDRDGASVLIGEWAAKCQGFGTLITKTNLWSAIEEASFMTGLERNSDIVKMSCYAPAFAKLNAQCWDLNMIWFDSQDVALTPDYYVQMLYSNNLGTQYIDATLSNDYDELYQSVTVDTDKEVIYVKLVNAGSAKNVTLDLDGFDDINYVSNQSISNNYKSASNEINKQRIAPTDEEITSNSNSISVKLEKNSVNVIRIAYGSNSGAGLYQLPDTLDLSTKIYIPAVVIGVAVGCATAVIIGSVGGFLIYTKFIVKKKNRKKEGEIQF